MESPQGAKQNNAEVLIVEDSPTQAEQLEHLLEDSGYTVTVASNGKEALAALRQRKPSLVISDIVMPEMDGYTLCHEIKSSKELKDIPVLLLTSLTGAEEVLKALQCGADNFVRKPYDGKRLLSLADYMLTNREMRKAGKTQMGLEIDISGEKHFITSERQQILDLLLSTFMDAVQLNRELQTREKELARSNQMLQGLYGIADALNRATSEQDALQQALGQAMKLPGVQAGWVSLREGETGFRLAATCGLPPVLEKPEAFEGDCLCRRKLIAGELEKTASILECERLQQAKGDTRGLRYHATVPLWIGNQILGVMNLAGPEQGQFNVKDLEILYSIGNQLAVALERTQLLQKMEEKVMDRTAALTKEIAKRRRAEEALQQSEGQLRLQLDHLAALRTIDIAINSTLDIRVTLSVFLDQVITQMGVHAADVLLLMPQAQMLENAIGRGFRSPRGFRSHLHLGKDPASRCVLERRIIEIPNLPAARAEFEDASFLEKEQFLSYFAAPLIAKGQVNGVLEIWHRESLAPSTDWLEFLEALAGQGAIAVDNARLYQDLQVSNSDLLLAYDTTLEGWVKALDMRDKETEGHTRRVTELTTRLAYDYPVPQEQVVHIRRGALLHDIGKMAIPDAILHKPGSLTPEEWAIMRLHTVYAHEWLSPIPYLRPALDIPYCHHEKWDGSGYPRGLKEEGIPLAARLFSVVDNWDALRSDRPYRPGWPADKVRAYVLERAGRDFDPHVVEIFLKHMKDYQE